MIHDSQTGTNFDLTSTLPDSLILEGRNIGESCYEIKTYIIIAYAAWLHFLLPGQPGRVSTKTLGVQPDNFLLMTLHTMAFVRSCIL